MNVYTNYEKLEKHLKDKFGKSFFESQEISTASKDVHTIMYKNVMNNIGSSPYDYNQTGDFLNLLRAESKGFHQRASRSSVKVGFGDLLDFNDRIYMRQRQTHKIHKKDGFVNITTKAETEMPKWIVAEFGTGKKADKVPRQFQIPYSRRTDKPFLVGPSYTMRDKSEKAVGKGKTPNNSGGFLYRKKTFLMMSEEGIQKLGLDTRKEHPGTKAGRFFSGGLADSQEAIKDRYEKAIREYLD